MTIVILCVSQTFLQAPSGLSMALSPSVQLLAVKLASPQDIPGYLEAKRHKHMIVIKNRTEYYLDWILSETGIEEPTEAPATTPTTAVPTEPPTTLPPFICPEGWVDSKTGCFKLLHTEVRN